MNDRKLLELAAKAAGIVPHSICEVSGSYLMGNPLSGWALGPPVWNPLRDEGDASRLAMKLCAEGKMKMQVVEDCIKCFYNHDGTFIPYTWGYETCTPDEAFRNCITGAAAAIGELMP